MKTYEVRTLDHLEALDQVPSLFIDTYPWYQGGLKQLTEVKMAIHEANLHIQVRAEDIHASAMVLKDNEGVYMDSCFEFFVMPGEARNRGYLNFEINCIGVKYIAYNLAGTTVLASKDQLEAVEVKTSLAKRRPKLVQSSDDFWTLDIKIPLWVMAALYGEDLSSNHWYGNFYRCGGLLDPQYAMWSPMHADKPNYHLPEQFGKLIVKD